MEFRIGKLGRIRDAKLDIRALTVFIGPNHTNKTWSAYALYGIARKIARIEFRTRPRSGFEPSAVLQAAVDSAADELARLLTDATATEVRRRLSRNDVIKGLPRAGLTFSLRATGLSDVLGIPESQLLGASAEVALREEEFERAVFSELEVTYKPAEMELEFSFVHRDGRLQRHPYTVNLSLRRGKSPSTEATDIKSILRGALVQAVETLAFTVLNDAAVLPAERKALVSMNVADFIRSINSVVSESVFASPVYDFLYMIESARRLSALPGDRPDFALKLAKLLEERIIQGSIDFDDEHEAKLRASRETVSFAELDGLRYATGEGVDLAVHATASIVRSMAGLDLYLKEFCDHGGFLVIDEPEMNAHPEAQLKIVEFLALLAQNGVRVILTTHSPYIVDHLSNLMQASRLSAEAKRRIAPKFKLGIAEAFLTSDEVSAYMFTESGAVADILDREQGIIDLTSFGQETEYMSNLVNTIWGAEDDSKQTAVQTNAV